MEGVEVDLRNCLVSLCLSKLFGLVRLFLTRYKVGKVLCAIEAMTAMTSWTITLIEQDITKQP